MTDTTQTPIPPAFDQATPAAPAASQPQVSQTSPDAQSTNAVLIISSITFGLSVVSSLLKPLAILLPITTIVSLVFVPLILTKLILLDLSLDAVTKRVYRRNYGVAEAMFIICLAFPALFMPALGLTLLSAVIMSVAAAILFSSIWKKAPSKTSWSDQTISIIASSLGIIGFIAPLSYEMLRQTATYSQQYLGESLILVLCILIVAPVACVMNLIAISRGIKRGDLSRALSLLILILNVIALVTFFMK